MQMTNVGMRCPQTADEILDVILDADLDSRDVQAEVMTWQGEDFEPLNGWGAELIVKTRGACDLVLGVAIGFRTRGDIDRALAAAGIREIAMVN